jgi:hypothetical protein
MKLAMRKIDNLGYNKSYGDVQMMQSFWVRPNNKLEFAQSIAVFVVMDNGGERRSK